MSAIKFENLWEKYRIKFIIDGKVSWEEIWALQDVNFSVEKGEVVGIIGSNGAGKTTLLRLIAGMLVADKGLVNVRGKVSALMELGAGFNPEFTGRENIIFNARVYGIAEDSLAEKINEIIEFSGLGKFIDAPIKYYSQGMRMRLAFSLAIFSDPDILLIDDILAVGDEDAQQKCLKKVFELKEAGKTIILVSHDMRMVDKLCSRVLLFEKGKVIRDGSPKTVVPYYLDTNGDKKNIVVLEQGGLKAVFNNGRLSIIYNGRYLSGILGGYTSFSDCGSKVRFSSTNLFWKIKSSLSDEFIAEGSARQDSECVQAWKVKACNGVLDFHIVNDGAHIAESNLDLSFVSDYDKWRFLDKDGSFPGFSHRSNWHDLGLQIFPGQKIDMFAASHSFLPGLTAETKNKNGVLKIFNSGYDQESRVIQAHPGDNRAISLSLKINS